HAVVWLDDGADDDLATTRFATDEATAHGVKAMSTSILEVSDLTMRFGGLLAVNGVGLTIKQGQIVSMIGPNGAGKTTVFHALTGSYLPTTRTRAIAHATAPVTYKPLKPTLH